MQGRPCGHDATVWAFRIAQGQILLRRIRRKPVSVDPLIKARPTYVIGSVDQALRLAAMLQLEGGLTVSEVAARLEVAPSTAHRLLQTLVYRDFARQGSDRSYHAGPVLELAGHSQSRTARLRATALPHMRRLVAQLEETVNLAIRTGGQARFIATVECQQTLRVGSREGMVFPAHRTTAGLLLLAAVPPTELAGELTGHPSASDDRPDPSRLRAELARVRKAGFAINRGRSEPGVVAVGVVVCVETQPVAGLATSMPSVRYDRHQLPRTVAALRATARAIEADLIRGERRA
jgi:DNA-binding IclR family transcriptional regulator